MPDEKTFTARISEVREAAARAKAGTFDLEQSTDALIAAAELIALLDLRAFEMSTDVDSDDTREMIVITVHGVDVEVRGRRVALGEEIYVHVDDRRYEDETRNVPLVVEVYSS